MIGFLSRSERQETPALYLRHSDRRDGAFCRPEAEESLFV